MSVYVYFSPEELKPHPKNAEIYEEREDKFFEESISDNGILEPLVVTSQKVILSGARRWKAALKLGLEKVPCRVEDPEDEVKAILEYNRYRHKTPREIYNELRIIKAELTPKAKEQQGVRTDLFSKLRESLEPIRVDKEAAERLDISNGQIYKIDYIYGHQEEQIAKPIVERLDRDEISIHQAFTEMKSMVEAPPKTPEEKHKTWKCGACLQEFELEEPVNITICPYCEMEFINWKAEKGFGDAGKQG